MKILAHIMVWVAWTIPGRSHAWARRLMAERKAGRDAMFDAGYCEKYGAHFGMHDNSDEYPV